MADRAKHTQQEHSAQKPANKRKRKRKRSGLGWIVLGVLILLYPVVATLYNDYRLDQTARSYSQDVKRIEPNDAVRGYLDAAHAYNDRLAKTGHHALPPEESSPGFDVYMKTLNAPETGGVIARIVVPSVQIDLPVYHSTHSDVLYRGAGHMFGSDLPVGGDGTNAVISAHTGMVNASMFDNLPRLKNGSDVYVEVMGQHLRYRVVGRQVVRPEDYNAVTYEPGKDKLTLITCTPYGINTDRLLVVAERVGPDGPPADKTWHPVLSWWMILDLTIILLVLLLLAYRRLRRYYLAKRRKREEEIENPPKGKYD